MSDRKRITVDCWSCRRHYSWLATFDGAAELYIACPFCGVEAVVQLAPYVSPERIIAAGDGPAFTLQSLNLPDLVPSEPRRPSAPRSEESA